MDNYPKSKQGGLWRNENSTDINKQPPYRGHLVVTKDMLKTLVVLMQNGAYDQSGQSPDLGPRIKLSAWLNTAKESGDKYFGIQADVWYPDQYDHLFDGSEEEAESPVATPSPTSPLVVEDDDFPF